MQTTTSNSAKAPKPIKTYLNGVMQSEERICEKHGKYMAHYFVHDGERKPASPCPQCEEEREQERQKLFAEECKAKEKNMALRRIENALGEIELPQRYRGRFFDSFKPYGDNIRANILQIARTYVEKYDTLSAKGIGIVFCGACGTGKTHLAAALLQELAQRGKVRGLYTTTRTMTDKFRGSWGQKEEGKTESEVLGAYQSVPLLVLDEVAHDGCTPMEKELVSKIIYARYDARLPTIFITNLPTEFLAAAIGTPELDRIKETCKFVNFKINSMRSNAVEF